MTNRTRFAQEMDIDTDRIIEIEKFNKERIDGKNRPHSIIEDITNSSFTDKEKQFAIYALGWTFCETQKFSFENVKNELQEIVKTEIGNNHDRR